jgi:regulator of cell morphogenesis and NO signaling
VTIDASKTVRELVAERPYATHVLGKLGIDFCCGGAKSLNEACASARVPVNEVIAQLENAHKAGPVDGARDWQIASLEELIRHIVAKHHAFTRAAIAPLEPLLAKVCQVHAKSHPELLLMREVIRGLSQELTMHMLKEEEILFPYIVAMEQASRGRHLQPTAMFGTVQNPVRMMMTEHDSAAHALRTLRETSNGYTLPADACSSYQTLYEALRELEADLHQHIHLENNILFPRAVSMEDRIEATNTIR